MKINLNNTALPFLYGADTGRFSTSHGNRDALEAVKFMNSKFTDKIEAFGQQVRFVSNTFLAEFHKSLSTLPENIKVHAKGSGTFIIDNGNGFATIFYDIDSTFENWAFQIKGDFLMFCKRSSDPEPALVNFVEVGDDFVNEYNSLLEEDLMKSSLGYMLRTMFLIWFIKKCPVQSIVIEPGRKYKTTDNKYINETLSTIEVLDKTWYTTSERKEGFWVGKEEGGFWRWQPFGPGLSDIKRIWIEAFEKKGYKRIAKVIKEDSKD